jgi:MerR HTH family regulatory protein
MNYGIERAYPGPEEESLEAGNAALQFGVSVEELEQYTREGILIALKTEGGARYTLSDYRWVATVRRLVREGGLSFEDVRHLLARCPCWKFRHCDFHSRQNCPLIKDTTKPCWINRSTCSFLSSHPCYCCSVYRSAPDCDGIRAVLSHSAPHS